MIKGSPTLVEFTIPSYQATWLDDYHDKELTLSITDKKRKQDQSTESLRLEAHFYDRQENQRLQIRRDGTIQDDSKTGEHLANLP